MAKAKPQPTPTPIPPSPDPHSFGPHLRRVRDALGLKQAEVAEKCGLSAQYITDLERGLRQPGYALGCKIMAGLGVPCTAFYPEGLGGTGGKIDEKK